MQLTDISIRNFKPQSTPRKLFDEDGLYLLVAPTGGKWWRFDYRFQGRRKTISLGVYPKVTLKCARTKRDDALQLLREGIDPSVYRKAERDAAGFEIGSFEQVATEWFRVKSGRWALSHSEKVKQRLERDLFPRLGKKQVADITALEVLETVELIQERGAKDTAHRAMQNCGQILRYAIQRGYRAQDVTRDLRGSLESPTHKHYPAFIEPDQVGALLRSFDAFTGSLQVKCALKLAPLVFVRPGELRKARWEDIDMKAAQWSFLSTKTKTDLIVPLSRQALLILEILRPLTFATGLVFPGRDPRKPMSEAAINAALRRLGYDTRSEITGHGFRAMARTLLHEKLRCDPNAIEHQLAHKVSGSLGAAYNRTRFLEDRVQMMQRWADYLDELCAAGTVRP